MSSGELETGSWDQGDPMDNDLKNGARETGYATVGIDMIGGVSSRVLLREIIPCENLQGIRYGTLRQWGQGLQTG
jgi:hypothetical protein